ncbi:MAG: Rieske (2Fe-2S) region, partial [uncultured Ramlibacter sp.]
EHQLPSGQAAERGRAPAPRRGQGHPLRVRGRHQRAGRNFPAEAEQGQRVPDRPPGPEGEALLQRRVRLLGAGCVAAGKHGPDPGPRRRKAAAQRPRHRDGAPHAARGHRQPAAGHRARRAGCREAACARGRRAVAARAEAAGVGQGPPGRRPHPARVLDM